MMSTLKPHLFAEMLDILATDSWERWSSNTFLSWKLGYSRAICAFALSSVHAYEVVAYLLKNVLTKTSRIDNKYVVFNRNMAYTTHPMSFMMDERHHIKALMRMAGQYCTVVFDGESHTDLCEWQQPIFDGLENNEVISSTLALRNYNVIKTLDRGRKVHDVIALSPSHFFITHKLALIKNGLIKNLIVRPMVRLQLDGFKAWDGLKIERIEFPDNSGGIFRRDVLHPHRPQAAYLKSFIMKTQIVVANVIQMLKRHLFLKELEFSVAMFKNERSYDFDNVADYVLKVVNFRDTVFAKFKRQDPIQEQLESIPRSNLSTESFHTIVQYAYDCSKDDLFQECCDFFIDNQCVIIGTEKFTTFAPSLVARLLEQVVNLIPQFGVLLLCTPGSTGTTHHKITVTGYLLQRGRLCF
uniref:DNA-directed RNA polymerase n=1 Tax=Panagrellus redivivus TaxID=6233 RepID=A0A7E4V2P3_PANRE